MLRGEGVALVLSDQRMPEMTGVEFLVHAAQVVPAAKRVLLTAYADTEAAITAINELRLDHYLMKPWHPPTERLFPVIDDLLDDWEASTLAATDGVRVLGHRWSASCHAVRDFLTRNQVPHRWLDVEGEEGRRLLAAAVPDGNAGLPVLVFADGATLVEPSTAEIADRVGLKTQADLSFYDLVIVGGGPAGSPPPSTGRPRACARCSSSGRRVEDRPARARGSRTTSAFPPDSAGLISPVERSRRPSDSAPSCSPRRR